MFSVLKKICVATAMIVPIFLYQRSKFVKSEITSYVWECVRENSRCELNDIKDGDINVNEKGDGGVTLLMIAVEKNNLSAVKSLISLGADINVKDDFGNTALQRSRINTEMNDLLKNTFLRR